MNLFNEPFTEPDVDAPAPFYDAVPCNEPARDPRQLELPWSRESSDG